MRLVFANEATAARRRVYFHIVDATDGITAETGEAAGQPQVSSDGAAFTNTGIGTLTHLGNGRYSADLTQTLVATAGVSIETRYKSAATAETPGDSVMVVAFNPYSTSLDLLLAAANLSSDTITAAKIATGAITAAKFAAGAIDAAAIATDAIDADAIAANAIDAGAIATGAITSAKFAAGAIDAAAIATDAITAAKIAADAIGASELAADAVTEIQSGLATSAALSTAQADLDDIQLRLPSPLTTGTADSGTTTTMTDAARTEADPNYWGGNWIRFTSGGASGQTRLITGFDPATDTITFTPVTTTIVSTNTYEIIPAAGVDVRRWNGSAPNNLISGRVDSSVGAMEANTLTASALATDAVNEIVDQVWDELIAGHLGAGSTGAALNGASAPSAAVVADAVWDEARAGHVAAGSFGEGVASVQGNVTGSVASVTGNVGGNVVGTVASVVGNVGGNVVGNVNGNVVGSVGSVAAGGITASSIATDAIDADALAASALAEINAEVDAALADIRLDEVIVNAASPITPTINSFWDRITSKDGSQTFDRATDSLEGIADSGSTPPSAATIADAVWDELLADHVTANTMGANQNLIDNINSDTDDIQTRLPAALVSGRMDSSVGAMAAGVVTAAAIATDAIDADAMADGAITAATFAAGAIDATAIAADAIGSSELAASAVTEIQAGLATSAALATVQADTDDIQARLPATLVGGRMRSHTEAMDAGVITATVIATDAIDADALAASALAEINAEVDTALVDIRLDEIIQNVASPVTPTINSFWDRVTSKDGSQTYDRSTDSLEAVRDALAAAGPSAAVIADAVWDELLADHVAVGSMGFNENLIDDVFADTNDIQTRLPAALVGGRMDSSVGAMAAGTVTAAAIATGAIDADALATDAVNEIVDQVWEEQLGDHSGTVGSTAEALDAAASGGSAPSAAVIADAVWDEALAGHVLAGSTGEAQNMIDDILTDTAAIQPLVDVAVSTRATPAQVNTEVDTALADIRLDELIQNVAAPVTPTIDSFLDRITSKNGAQTYDRSTDSLEAASDAIVAAGPSAAVIADAVWDEALAGHLIAGSAGANQNLIDDIEADITTIMGPGFNPLTDSLEEIRDEVDACCGVGGNGADHVNVEGI